MNEFLDALSLGVRSMFAYQAVFFALLAMGLNLHFGYTGLLNFGQIAFAMVGGFGIAISVTQWGLPFFVGVLIGLVAAVVLALLLGLPTLRLVRTAIGAISLATHPLLPGEWMEVSAPDLKSS